MKYLKPLFILLLIFIFCNCNAQSLTFSIRGIENSKGHLQVSLFENQKQFSDETPAQMLYFDKKDIINGIKNITINLKPGTYGMTVLDDEDDSKEMTFRLRVYPLEGVGFSNYKLKGMTKPKFTDFSFTIPQGHQKIIVDMKYF